ncbi:hypothetical protein CYMTET_29497 [Cymbomonas tetramitiformis]|uniref:Nudix hydrolase domain-containing protein n=1 Tax=Cymbomonas tetramitiformis TaxID=36881 RepID=A0AAE0FKQ5_9CHLO|nr:hypothetical protein CYMTET_29497 [Cymbomonas tetramitiformis]
MAETQRQRGTKGGNSKSVATRAKGPSQQVPQKNGVPSQELLDDLSIRFVVNAPAEDLQTFERMLFLIEQAHWFYEDNIREQLPLKSLSLREFAVLMFQQCITLKPYQRFVDDIYKSFTIYKHNVPVCGALVLNPAMDKVLLVKGWKSTASWGFPKGKVNKDEPRSTCAIREVMEEIGYDISGGLVKEDFIAVTRGQQLTTLFIIPDVDESTPFAPLTQKEIGSIEWFPVSKLPVTSKNSELGKKFFMVHCFVTPLVKWISKRRKQRARSGVRALRPSYIQDDLTTAEADIAATPSASHPCNGDSSFSDAVYLARAPGIGLSCAANFSTYEPWTSVG